MPLTRLIFLLCLLPFISATAQEFGGHPSSQQWRQLDADSFRIIFPKGLEKNAMAIRGYIQNIEGGLTLTNKRRYRSIPIVLQHRTNISNGYVGMGPWRSEYYLSPSQNSFRLGSLPWEEQLALHEYRHVQQNRHFMKGLTGAVYSVLGQDAGSLTSNMAIPNWFWEGDAVFQETALSSQGRGRIPNFFNEFRSIWTSGKHYSWQKIRNGSLRDRIPDHYELGYLLVAYGNEKYGPGFWKNVTADAAAYKGLFYPFQRAIKKYSGQSFRNFRKDALQHYFIDKKNDSLSLFASQRNHFNADYDFPQWLNDSTIIYVRSGYDAVPFFASMNIRTGKEEKISDRFISLDRQFSTRHGKVVYTSYTPDRRWNFIDYSDLVLLDLQTNTSRYLSRKARLFSPDIDDAGKQVVAVKLEDDGSSSLQLVKVENGNMHKIFSHPQWYLTYPKFYGNDSLVAAVRNEAGEMSIISISILSGEFNTVIPFSKRIIGFLNADDSILGFTASIDSVEKNFVISEGNLYEILTASKSAIGVYQPAHHNGKWIMQGVTAVGNVPVLEGSTKAISMEDFLQHDAQGPYPNEAWKKEHIPPITTTMNHDDENEPYHQGRHLFNFHSLRPYVTGSDISLSILSQNILNNLLTSINGQYNLNEKYKKIGASMIYAGWYPWIKASVDYSIDRNARYRNSRVYWNEIEPSIGLSLPLNYTSGKWYRFLQPGIDYVHNKTYIQGIWKDSLQGRSYGYLHPSIRYTAQQQKARKNIYPRFAQDLLLSYKKAVGKRTGQQFLGSANFYLPGLFANHSFVINGAFQSRDSGLALFTNNFFFSRGYESENFRQMYRVGLNYHLPLWYPDRGIASIVYFLRIRSNIFFDYTRASDDNRQNRLFRSTGTEIFFDTKWWNQQPLSLGIRYSRLLDEDLYYAGKNVWEIVIPVLF